MKADIPDEMMWSSYMKPLSESSYETECEDCGKKYIVYLSIRRNQNLCQNCWDKRQNINQ